MTRKKKRPIQKKTKPAYFSIWSAELAKTKGTPLYFPFIVAFWTSTATFPPVTLFGCWATEILQLQASLKRRLYSSHIAPRLTGEVVDDQSFACGMWTTYIWKYINMYMYMYVYVHIDDATISPQSPTLMHGLMHGAARHTPCWSSHPRDIQHGWLEPWPAAQKRQKHRSAERRQRVMRRIGPINNWCCR